MSAELQELISFHLTGKLDNTRAMNLAGAGFVPAVLAPYRDLSRLRYDYPLILVDGAETPAYVDTLSGVINRLLRSIAPEGNTGEQLRQHVLRLEQRMRELAAGDHGRSLSELWKQAEKSLLAECAADESEWLGNSIATARFALQVDGQVVDCDEQLPERLLVHAWRRFAGHGHDTATTIDDLIIRLRNLLKVDDLKNSTSRTPQRLKATVGKRYREAFDFDRMAELLDESTPHNRLPPERRERIANALEILESQRFFALPRTDRPGKTLHEFVFDSLATALKAYRAHLPEISDVVRAMAIANLELDNAWADEKHRSFFERFGPRALTPEDLARFPACLVCLHESECSTRDLAHLMEIVSCDLPIKVLVHVSDPLGATSAVEAHAYKGTFVQQLVHHFVAGDAFVLQSPASHLYREREQIQKGLEFAGPAIFSIYAPLTNPETPLPAYLVSAAALESRVFPAFSYDPRGGNGLASRFDISCNPELEVDWPSRELRFEDEKLQAVVEDVPFTAIDFTLLEPAYAEHFALAPRAAWGDDLVAAAEYIDRTDLVDAVPCVSVVSDDNTLQKLVVDEQLVRLARRCRERWHALQELGGVHNSYAAAAALAAAAERAQVPQDDTAGAAAVAPVDNLQPEAAPEAEISTDADEATDQAEATDEPYIETPRCTSCDECTTRNDRMFAYDDNKQAYIKDPDAGTFRELVEAAEICQVAIIHPGKPRNPDEPGLDDLLERAAAFNG